MLRQGDIGTRLHTQIRDGRGVVNVAAATSLEVRIVPPSGGGLTRTATFDTIDGNGTGSDGRISYTTVDGDLAATGPYGVQFVIGFAGGLSWATEVTTINVEPRI
jgi:5-hydroxyisourate hydrolase-like protein (transthyretin family)